MELESLYKLCFWRCCDAIANVNAPTPGHTDFPSWKVVSDGQFTLKSAYTSLLDDDTVGPSISIFKKVWSWEGPSRMKSILWKLAHGTLLINSKRECLVMTYAPRCNLYPETVMHMLRDFDHVHDFWSKNINPIHWSRFFSLCLQA